MSQISLTLVGCVSSSNQIRIQLEFCHKSVYDKNQNLQCKCWSRARGGGKELSAKRANNFWCWLHNNYHDVKGQLKYLYNILVASISNSKTILKPCSITPEIGFKYPQVGTPMKKQCNSGRGGAHTKSGLIDFKWTDMCHLSSDIFCVKVSIRPVYCFKTAFFLSFWP